MAGQILLWKRYFCVVQRADPVRVGLIGVVIFEDQMDPVGIAIIGHTVSRHVVDLARFALREMVGNPVDEKSDLIVGDDRDVR